MLSLYSLFRIFRGKVLVSHHIIQKLTFHHFFFLSLLPSGVILLGWFERNSYLFNKQVKLYSIIWGSFSVLLLLSWAFGLSLLYSLQIFFVGQVLIHWKTLYIYCSFNTRLWLLFENLRTCFRGVSMLLILQLFG